LKSEATVNQFGNDNQGTINQNLAVLGRIGNNDATLTQSGNRNLSTLTQDGHRNSINVEQAGVGTVSNPAEVYVTQTADSRLALATVKQTAASSKGYVRIVQTGDKSPVGDASANRNTNPLKNSVDVTQSAANNRAEVDQDGVDNYTKISQSGDGVVADVSQSGTNNSLLMNQTGDRAYSLVNQTGADGSLTINQFADDASSTVTQGGVGNSAVITQGTP
jgi:hypothetical protein